MYIQLFSLQCCDSAIVIYTKAPLTPHKTTRYPAWLGLEERLYILFLIFPSPRYGHLQLIYSKSVARPTSLTIQLVQFTVYHLIILAQRTARHV